MTTSVQRWSDGKHRLKWLFIEEGECSERAVLHKDSTIPVIRDLWVNEDLRGYGIGSKFLKQVEDYLFEYKNVNHICVGLGKNDEFYLNRGYKRCEDEDYLIKTL